MSGRSSPGDAGEAAALVLAAQEFVANGGRRSWSAPPECCIAGADGQPWRCRSAWLLAFQRSSEGQLRRRLLCTNRGSAVSSVGDPAAVTALAARLLTRRNRWTMLITETRARPSKWRTAGVHRQLVVLALMRRRPSGSMLPGACCCLTPDAAVRAVSARLLLLCLLLRSSWLAAEGGRQVGAARVLHRRGGGAAVAVGVAVGVPTRQRRRCAGGLLVPRTRAAVCRRRRQCSSSSRAGGSSRSPAA
jgi:hypothetical protein